MKLKLEQLTIAERTNPRLIAERFTCAECTLNGERAVIRGRLNPFATVRSLDSDAEYTYSWPVVAYVMTKNDGAFRS